MKAMIFAAGMGTRLKPITDTMPKALVPVCGRPLLSHVVGKLHSAGFSDFVINVHHFAQQIRDYVKSEEFVTSIGSGSDGQEVKISFSDETDLLRETGGGIRHAAALLNDGEPLLIHNVDILSNLDVENFYKKHCENYDTVLATLLVSDRKTERYLLFDNEDNLVAWMNIKTGEVKSPFLELRREAIIGNEGNEFDYEPFLQEYGLKKYAFAGVHVLSPEAFRLMSDKPEKFSIITFYLSYCNKYQIKAHVEDNLTLVDVGKLDSLQLAEEMAKQL